MRPLVKQVTTRHSPESLAARIEPGQGLVLLQSRLLDSAWARYSLVAARPFLRFRSSGSRCEVQAGGGIRLHFGNPWCLLESLMARYESTDEIDLPFPLGGCFGFWGYELKNFVEPKLPRQALDDLHLPDCQVGFYGSLVVFDHRLDAAWVVATGMDAEGSVTERRAREEFEFWENALVAPVEGPQGEKRVGAPAWRGSVMSAKDLPSTLKRHEFIERVRRAQAYIRSGDIYQVNLSHRLSAPHPSPWAFYGDLSSVSPAPFSAYVDAGDFQLVSSSPELFLRLSGSEIRTRPIKGTRPRSGDPIRDAQLTYELQTSAKEMAELVMITDLLRNDLGKICEFGSVRVPELVRLEQYSQVQHLVSTVEGRLREEYSHFAAFASTFPGGSVTGAPKFRAMEIIDELEPTVRGPYTGAIGYLGFNRESQLSITIRTAICKDGLAHFPVGAGIVADSIPEAEYDETLAKAAGFVAALSYAKDASAEKPHQGAVAWKVDNGDRVTKRLWAE